MTIYLLSIATGLVFGASYTYLNLPLPAPISLAGVLGIFGVWLGYFLVNAYR